ncbi:MAG: hypothetical protein VB861_16555, partial [Planctomycetaceae bacterium]
MHLRTVFLGNMLLLTASGWIEANAAGPAGPVGATEGSRLSVTGRADKRLAALDRLMTGFLERHKLPGA